MDDKLTRRQFVRDGVVATAALSASLGAANTAHADPSPKKDIEKDPKKILNFNPDMEYRRLGKTGLTVSAVALGGHWKRVVKVIGGKEPKGWMTMAINRPDFQKNRLDIVNRCIERGFNYVDACCREEILAYAKALRG